jgi:enoyl-CoA hydratase/carnithine racemase
MTASATHRHERPERRNALSEAHMQELLAAFRELGEAPDTRAVVLGANGPVFSAGHDFGDMAERDLAGMRKLLATARSSCVRSRSCRCRSSHACMRSRPPAGCQLVASCDLAVARRHGGVRDAGRQGRLVLPYARGGGGPRRGPQARARDAAHRRRDRCEDGARVGSRESRRPRCQGRRRAESLARAASRGSLASKALGKRTIYDTIDLDVDAAYAIASEAMATSAVTEDGREGCAPSWKSGRGVYPPRR